MKQALKQELFSARSSQTVLIDILSDVESLDLGDYPSPQFPHRNITLEDIWK
jgi:hypothetical protein